MYYTFFPVYNHGALYSRFSSSAPLVLSTSISDSRPVTSLPSQLSQAHLDGHPPISPTPTLMHDIYHLYLLLVPTLIARLLVIVPTFRSSRSSVELDGSHALNTRYHNFGCCLPFLDYSGRSISRFVFSFLPHRHSHRSSVA
jgi:hypothetical protein